MLNFLSAVGSLELSDRLPATANGTPVVALHFDFPDSLSPRALAVLDYLDGTAFLFWYDGRLVVTDESLELCESRWYGPRWTGASVADLEGWLEAVYPGLLADGYVEDVG